MGSASNTFAELGHGRIPVRIRAEFVIVSTSPRGKEGNLFHAGNQVKCTTQGNISEEYVQKICRIRKHRVEYLSDLKAESGQHFTPPECGDIQDSAVQILYHPSFP